MSNDVVKFNAVWIREHPESVDVSEIGKYKPYLLDKGLIGTLTTGEWEGYDIGNISIRHTAGMLISCSQTSRNSEVVPDDFALVVKYNPDKFEAFYYGDKNKKPSSETPMHWSAYEADKRIGAIVHAHIVDDEKDEYGAGDERLIKFFGANDLPMTHSQSKSKGIGDEIKRLIEKEGYEKVVGMQNHDGGFGLLAMGENLGEAYSRLMSFHEQLKRYQESQFSE